MNQGTRLFQVVTAEVILPILVKLDEEAKQSITAKVSGVVLGETMTHEICSRGTKSENGAIGEVRIALKESAVANRFIFSGESIFEGLSPGTGFSGFSIRGTLTLADGQFSTELTARSNRYNVWNWGKDFVSLKT